MSENIEIKNENKTKGDNFWSDNPRILFNKDKLHLFFPTKEMTLIEKLNAIARLSIYLGVLLYIFSGYKSNYLFISIIVMIITIFIYKNQKNNMEMYFNSYNNSSQNIENEKILIGNKDCTQPTTNNPFMNINLITDPKNKKKACKSWNSNPIKNNIENKFKYNLYRDVSDLYNKNNSQRQYYTMPSTTIPNDQTAFAKWCFNTGPTCKEKTLYCAPPFSVVNDTSNVLKEVPRNF